MQLTFRGHAYQTPETVVLDTPPPAQAKYRGATYTITGGALPKLGNAQLTYRGQVYHR